MTQPLQTDSRDPRFAAALELRGAKRWADASFPYELAGAGTAAGKGAAAAIEGGAIEEAAIEEAAIAEEEPGVQTAAAVVAPAAGAVFVTEGDQAGAIGVVVRPGYLHGATVRTALLRDLALPPDAVAARGLVAAAIDFARSQGAVVAAIGSPSADAPLADLTAGWDAVPAFRRVAEFRAIRLVPVFWRMEDPEYKVLGATKTELPALAYLLDYYRQGFALAPPVDEPSFVAGIERCPNLKVTDFRLARYKGELAAICAAWEPGPALPITLQNPSPGERLLGLIGRILGRLSPFPRLPGAGKPLRVRFVRSFAMKLGHPAVLRYLLDRIANEARKAGAHAIEVVLPAGDPMLELVVGRMRRVRSTSVWAAALSPEVDLVDLAPVDPGILDPGF